jgi:penicillin-binding protein 1A
LSKRTILLILIFIASFWWASGDLFLKKYQPSFIPKLTDKTLTASSNKIFQVVALKSAVDSKLNKKSYTYLRDIPLDLQHAIIAVEDARFYNHYGLDYEGILRAMLVNLQSGSISEGGSTITQQLVKNLFLSPEQTMGRKVEEAILAMDMELRYSKDEILEMYLNTIYFGSGTYGITSAAKVYFNKSPGELNLAECTMLAGLPNAPSLTSPYTDFLAAKDRQAIVIASMVKRDYLSSEEAQRAKNAPIILANRHQEDE